MYVCPTFLLPPASEMLRGILVWDCPWVSLSVSLCVGYAHTGSRTVGDRILAFHMWINYVNERVIHFFFVAFGVAELHPFI